MKITMDHTIPLPTFCMNYIYSQKYHILQVWQLVWWVSDGDVELMMALTLDSLISTKLSGTCRINKHITCQSLGIISRHWTWLSVWKLALMIRMIRWESAAWLHDISLLILNELISPIKLHRIMSSQWNYEGNLYNDKYEVLHIKQ